MPSVDYEKEAIPVQLGFSESIVPSDLGILAHNSPNWGEWDGGKIGGVPSWINPRDIPKIAPLRCEVCANRTRRRNDGDANNSTNGDEEGTMLRFVTQIYSPADSETGNDNAFHRSIYVFCCPHPECALGKEDHLNESSVVILRGQMSKENDFYPEDSDVEEIGWNKHESQAWNLNTCVVCGQRSSGKCPLTNQYFCGKKHQAAYHKAMKKHTNIDVSLLRYAESELVVEEEPVEQSGDGGEEEQTAKKINQSSIFVQEESGNKKHEKESEAKDDEFLEQSDLNQMTGSATGTSDPLTVEFYTRIGRADGDVKEQCLRYCRWAERSEEGNTDNGDDGDDGGPLWISSNDRPTSKADIPPCEYCGAERRFEFQVMPQMINFLKTSETDESAKKGKGSKLNLTEDGKRALMAASDIVDKAKEEGTEMDLPAEFQKKQEELVDMFKSKLFQNDGEGGESLDFGTIAIYTCTASCGGADYNDNRLGAYHKEFGWRQKSLE